jgi:hypothetical protein
MTKHPETPTQPKLVDARGLLEALFDESSRPSLRWLRNAQAQRKIPFMRLGRLIRFDPSAVRAAIEEDCTVHSRKHLRRN